MHRGRTLRRKGRKPAEDIIMTELEKAPGTFTKLRVRSGLADSTLSEHLKNLEAKGEIAREYRKGELLIKLSDSATSPIEKTLRHLEALAPHNLDIEVGRELLTNEFVNTFFYGRFEDSKEKLKEHGIEFNEYYLLKILANFNTELRFAEGLNKGENIVSWMWIDPKLAKLLKKKIEDPELFLALGVARQLGILKQLEDLLDWISPLLEPHAEAEMRKTSQKWREMAGKHLLVLSPWNLAAAAFMAEERDYFKKVLSPLWNEKLRSSLRGKKKEKGRK